MKNLNYFLYMAEVEGVDSVTNTRFTLLNKAINDFVLLAKRGYDINDTTIQDMVLKQCDLEDITENEVAYIVRKFSKKI